MAIKDYVRHYAGILVTTIGLASILDGCGSYVVNALRDKKEDGWIPQDTLATYYLLKVKRGNARTLMVPDGGDSREWYCSFFPAVYFHEDAYFYERRPQQLRATQIARGFVGKVVGPTSELFGGLGLILAGAGSLVGKRKEEDNQEY